MIDSKTGKRVIVLLDPQCGPYIRIPNWDEDVLEDYFSEDYGILYGLRVSSQAIADNETEYSFGNAIAPLKLQKILDEIIL